MILSSSPLKNDPPETTVSIFFFLEIEIVTTKIVNSKSLKKICRQLLSTMNVLKLAYVVLQMAVNNFSKSTSKNGEIGRFNRSLLMKSINQSINHL